MSGPVAPKKGMNQRFLVENQGRLSSLDVHPGLPYNPGWSCSTDLALFSLIPGGTPLLCASLEHPGGPHDRAGVEAAKSYLVSKLWSHFSAGRDNVAGSQHAPLGVEIRVDGLGKPSLYIAGCNGASISFSRLGGRVWAAISEPVYGCGIDVAAGGEFGPRYPYHRAFSHRELAHALAWTHGNLPEAAALLWSIKEAVVKAAGCGFHRIDPLQVRTVEMHWGGSAIHSLAELLALPQQDLTPITTCSVAANVMRLGTAWISGAVARSRHCPTTSAA